MASKIQYKFFHAERLLGEGAVDPPFTVGRQADASDPEPVSEAVFPSTSSQYRNNGGVARKLIIVPLSNRSVPRLSLRVDLDERGEIVARNLHRAIELSVRNREVLRPGQQLAVGASSEIWFPNSYRLEVTVGPSSVPNRRSLAFEDDDRSYVALDFNTKMANEETSRLLAMINEDQPLGRQEIAVRMVRTALEAFKEAPGSEEFFEAAGRAAIRMIDLDRVAVLLKEGGDWTCRAQAFRPGMDQDQAGARHFSRSLLAKMEASGKTTIVEPTASSPAVWVSIIEVDRCVASPILDAEHKVVGALYGDRSLGGGNNNLSIGELEAALLEVLATGISSSLAIEQEQKLRSSMSQFFSPLVLSQLRKEQTLLDARETEVTVLFCDIRGFSSVTENIGPTKAIGWINDVLTNLSECVLNYDGVLVDYMGDELMAMWGAPAHQPDHAERACRAAIDMLGLIGPLGEKWQGVVSSRFGFGIGINSGPASVGNTGSKKKFKYGPLGNTVNVASRVQGITKQLSVPGIVTAETAAAAIHGGFHTRKLATARVVGIKKTVDLFQLFEDGSQSDLCKRYEQALRSYEQNDLQRAAGRLASIVQDYPEDRPTIILLSRAVEFLTQSDREFDPVWNLTHK